MMAITVRQPFASCIAIGAKTVENRGRPVVLRHIGELVAIHAGKKPDLAGDTDPRITGLFGADPRIGQPMGAVIAVATLIDCHPAAYGGAPGRTCCQPWGDARYRGGGCWHLVLAGAVALDQPVPARGALRVPWAMPEDVAVQVADEYALAVHR